MKLLPETRERVAKVFRGEADSVPILAQINEHVVTLCGGDMREAYTDAKKLVEMNLAVSRPKPWANVSPGNRIACPTSTAGLRSSASMRTWSDFALRISEGRPGCPLSSTSCAAPMI